jgi:hypothetical protein
MAFTPYTGAELPNLVNVTQRMDPDGSIAKIGELLQQFNPVIEDIPLVQGNLPTGHRHTVRSDIPTPTWRRLNYGVRPTKSTTAQVDDTLGMCEDYSEIDRDLASINDNSAEFRMSEDMPHIEGISNEMASKIFYGDTTTEPEAFLGISPRYDALTLTGKPTATVNSAYLKHVVSAGGSTASSQTSVYLVVWGPYTVFGIYPKGSKAGLLVEDKGQQTLFDNDGGRFEGYRTHYQWKMGLCVKDWRYIVRVCNIELLNMDDATAQRNLYHALIKAKYAIPQNNLGTPVFYASSGVHAMLDIAAVEKGNAALGYANIFGKEVLTFRGIPIKPCDAILETEAVVS